MIHRNKDMIYSQIKELIWSIFYFNIVFIIKLLYFKTIILDDLYFNDLPEYKA
jgi:hypothetical protein